MLEAWLGPTLVLRLLCVLRGLLSQPHLVADFVDPLLQPFHVSASTRKIKCFAPPKGCGLWAVGGLDAPDLGAFPPNAHWRCTADLSQSDMVRSGIRASAMCVGLADVWIAAGSC